MKNVLRIARPDQSHRVWGNASASARGLGFMSRIEDINIDGSRLGVTQVDLSRVSELKIFQNPRMYHTGFTTPDFATDDGCSVEFGRDFNNQCLRKPNYPVMLDDKYVVEEMGISS
ncbi:hypothetical protein B0H13DRAFT_1875954 [Mycena leptocephala]|nr:hypothetical protein B0H13DRAFT_1875954 [Mycena leptocephala]